MLVSTSFNSTIIFCLRAKQLPHFSPATHSVKGSIIEVIGFEEVYAAGNMVFDQSKPGHVFFENLKPAPAASSIPSRQNFIHGFIVAGQFPVNPSPPGGSMIPGHQFVLGEPNRIFQFSIGIPYFQWGKIGPFE